MKQTSTQQSNEPLDSLRDDIYTLFQMEVERRGLSYFTLLSTFPTISQGASSATIEALLGRLALSPSIFSIITTKDPDRTVNDLICGLVPNSDKTDGLIRDFIDDISLNVRIKAPDLYALRLSILKDHVECTTPLILDDPEDINTVVAYFNRNQHLILTLYYLRKLGYGTLTKSASNK